MIFGKFYIFVLANTINKILMIKIPILLFLLFFSAFVFTVFAQEPAPAPATGHVDYTSEGVRVYERGVKLSSQSVRSIFYGTPAYAVYAKGIRLNRIGHGLLWPGVWFSAGGLYYILLGMQFGNDSMAIGFITRYFGITAFVFGLPFIGTGIALRVKGKRMVGRAVNMYNDYTDSSTGNYFPEISFGITSGGLGLVYKF